VALAMITFLSAVFLLFTSLLGDKSLFQLHRMEQGKKEWLSENARLTEEVDELREKVRAVRNDRFVVEKIAREELGMVRKDEIVYLFSPVEIRASSDVASGKKTNP
jgi:cell division protein FtsB